MNKHELSKTDRIILVVGQQIVGEICAGSAVAG